MNIKDSAELIVFQDEIQYRVHFGKVKSSTVSLARQKTLIPSFDGTAGIIIPGFHFDYDQSTGVLDVPIAKRANATSNEQGIPGLMFPGLGLSYNEQTGELTRDFETSLTFAGLIGNDITEGHVTAPQLDDKTGYFYIVADTNFTTLTNDWGSASFTDVNVGDKVIRKYDGDWAIVADVSGSLAVFEILSDTEALKVDSTNNHYPVLTIDNVTPADVVQFDDPIVVTDRGIDGLMTDIDKAKLDNLNVLLEKSLVSEITTNLPLTHVNTTDNGRLVKVDLDIEKATSSEVGVVKLSENSDIENMISNPKVSSVKLQNRNMLSSKQAGMYFLPNTFLHLDTISSYTP